MEGIVSLLHEEHNRRTESLWAELEGEFGLRGIYTTPFPHFSYHVAQGYDQDKLGLILRRLAQQTPVFQAQASGLGIFTGTPPVLYLPIVRTRELSEFHATVWQQIAHTATGTVEYYHPDNWLPHITLAFGDIHKENLPDVIRLLSERPLHWAITINNLSFVKDTGEERGCAFVSRSGGALGSLASGHYWLSSSHRIPLLPPRCTFVRKHCPEPSFGRLLSRRRLLPPGLQDRSRSVAEP